MYIRSSDTEEGLKDAVYSETIENGGSLEDLHLKQYIQYKLELGAVCGCGTPRVTEVRVDFA